MQHTVCSSKGRFQRSNCEAPVAEIHCQGVFKIIDHLYLVDHVNFWHRLVTLLSIGIFERNSRHGCNIFLSEKVKLRGQKSNQF